MSARSRLSDEALLVQGRPGVGDLRNVALAGGELMPIRARAGLETPCCPG